MLRIGLLFSRSVLLACIFALPAAAQTPTPTPNPTPAWSKSANRVRESDFLKNIVADQKAIWTSPFHIGRSDWKWLGPFAAGTAALIATDKTTSTWVSKGGSLPGISRQVSEDGGVYIAGGLSAGMYLVGRWKGNDHLRETGLLAAEALIHSQVVTQAAKLVFERQRPNQADSEGEFFSGKGSSFFSGHASSSWSVATVIACEYHNNPFAVWGSYGLATAVSLSRYAGRKHFLSDVVVGSAVGYGIGRYVCHKRASLAERDDNTDNTVSRRWQVLPYLNARTGAKGGSFVWQF
jgi:membrane-associated phospholipid phosphatase